MTDGIQETSNPFREPRVGDRRVAAKADPCVPRPWYLDRKELFLRLMISLDAIEAQESDVYDLMGEVDARLSHGEAAWTTSSSATASIGRFPGHEPQHIAEAIVTRLGLEGGWDQVYQHLRQSGMNLRDLREERGF